MGMGYAGASAYVIKDGKVEELCPDEYAALVGALKVDSRMADEDGISQYEEAELVGLAAKSVLMWDGGYRKLDEPTQAAWLALKEKFNEVTGGLELGVSYHDSEAEGSRYDEIGRAHV